MREENYLHLVAHKGTRAEFVEWLRALERMGIGTWLIPLLAFALLLMLRGTMEGQDRVQRGRNSSTLAIAVLGFVAMAMQMQLLLSYQAHVGFVFGRIALLNGCFMTGLALGAGALGQRLARAHRAGLLFAVVLAMVALGAHVLPDVLAALSDRGGLSLEAAYLALVCAAGALTGIGFPLGVSLAHRHRRDVLATSGIVEAADHLGGALGGILSGAALVPLLGIAGTSRLLTISTLIALVVVLWGEFGRSGSGPFSRWWRARGYVSFPFPRVTWTLAFLVITVFLLTQLARSAAVGPVVLFDKATLQEVSGSEEFVFAEEPMPHYVGSPKIADPGGERPAVEPRTVTLASMPVASHIRGYAGPLNLLVSVDHNGIVRAVRYLHSDETPVYIYGIEEWLTKLAGFDLSERAIGPEDVDMISGATISSKAAIATVNQAARAGARHGLGISVAPAAATAAESTLAAFFTTKVVIALILFALLVPAFLSGREWARIAYQGAVLVFLGFVFNGLFTEIDVANLSMGRIPSVNSNPYWYLLIGVAVLTTLLWGQVYCGYVCPYGALQEFISRIGRFLRLRGYALRWLDMRMRYAKFVLAAAALGAFWLTDDLVWVSFNPMQRFFEFDGSAWLGLLAVASLIGALFYYRFWCRYLCPMGAILAIGNKLAVFRRGAPRRVFKYCDLGVRDEFDVDCIQCNRCVTRVDVGLREKKLRVL